MDIGDYIKLYSLPTGRRLYAARKVLEAARERNANEIAALAERAVEHDTKAFELERQYVEGKAKPKSAEDDKKSRAQLLDERLDAAVRALHDGANAFLNFDESSAQHVAAREFLKKAFPAGLGAITQLAFVEELEAVNRLVAQLKGDLAGHVKTLNLSPHVSHVEQRLEPFRDAVGENAPEVVDFSTVRAARATGQEYIVRLTVKIFGQFDGNSAGEIDARHTLFGPIAAQNEKVSSYLKRRRRVLDVDPNSGEEDD